MEDHLKRALIEVYYAIAEFDQEKAMMIRNGDAKRIEDLETALGTARAALDASLELMKETEAAKASA